jgi:hypothetical protein
MAPNPLVALLGLISVISLIGYSCHTLLQFSRYHEDAEHEQLWRYLLRPSRP